MPLPLPAIATDMLCEQYSKRVQVEGYPGLRGVSQAVERDVWTARSTSIPERSNALAFIQYASAHVAVGQGTLSDGDFFTVHGRTSGSVGNPYPARMSTQLSIKCIGIKICM